MYIAVAGNIGSGKTTLTEKLTKHYGGQAYYEEPNNPYIGDFYEDMPRWSFNLQIYFLSSRIEQIKHMLAESHKAEEIHTFQDRTIYEDAHIFAGNLHQMGLMTGRDFATYMKTFNLFSSFIPKPDLLIYLKASPNTLVEQIKQRGREYESNIDISYLLSLNERYDNWITNIYSGNLFIVDMDKREEIGNEELFKMICDHIDQQNR